MNDKNTAIIGGVVAFGLVLFLVLKGSTSSSQGVSWGQANPASVQALYSANAANVASTNSLQASRYNNLSDIAKAVIGASTVANTNAAGVQTSYVNAQSAQSIAQAQADVAKYTAAKATEAQIAGSNAAVQSQTVQSLAAVDIANAGAKSAIEQAYYNAQSAMGVASTQAYASVGVATQQQIAAKNIASSQAQSDIGVATQQADAAKAASFYQADSQKYASQISKEINSGNNKTGVINKVIGAVGKIFGF